jgi:hypothetical protein
LRQDKARNVVIGRLICLPNHVCPREITRARQTNARLSRRHPIQRSTHCWIILQCEFNRFFERKYLFFICAGLREGALTEAHQENESDRYPSHSGAFIF